MDEKTKRFWTFEDYQRFLSHPEALAREWAIERIKAQYPQQLVDCLLPLLDDQDLLVRERATLAVYEHVTSEHESRLLYALAQVQGSGSAIETLIKNYLLNALGRIQSRAILQDLIIQLDAIEARIYSGKELLGLRGIIEALGYYPDEEAQEALWRFIERYPYDETLIYHATTGLLRFATPDTIQRLVQRLGQLTPVRRFLSEGMVIALAEVVGLRRLTEEILSLLDEGPDSMLEIIESWLEQPVPLSGEMVNALIETFPKTYQGLIPIIQEEITRTAAKRGDDLEEWQASWAAGERPSGYRWRMTYAYTVISALAAHPPASPEMYQRVVGLCMALLAQVVTDRNDEAALEAASDDQARREILLDILGSPRQNIMPDIIDQIVAYGPDIVSGLITILESGPFWGKVRALQAVEKIARTYPGQADEAIPYILDTIERDEGDYTLEAAEEALRAIGTAVVEPAVARLSKANSTYMIYVSSALSEIPTEASLEALLEVAAKDNYDEFSTNLLTNLGHARAIPILRKHYTPHAPFIGLALYTLGILNGYAEPEMEEWREIAYSQREREKDAFEHILDEIEKILRIVEVPSQIVKHKKPAKARAESRHKAQKARRRRKKKKKKRRR